MIALTADDNVFYQVNSTTAAPRTSSWYGRFTGPSASFFSSGELMSITYRRP